MGRIKIKYRRKFNGFSSDSGAYNFRLVKQKGVV